MSDESEEEGGDMSNRFLDDLSGRVNFLEVIGVPSRLSLTCKASSLVRVLPTYVLRYEENTERWKWKSPLVDDPVRIKVSQSLYVRSQTYYQ
jgi:hypothetical protein